MSTTRKRSWNWMFGVNAWVDFSTGAPVSKTKPVGFDNFEPGEGCDTISDPDTGDLLFYTDGIAIWGADHKIKQVAISSVILDPDESIQAITVVRKPGSTSIYYLFMVGDWTTSATAYRQIEYRTYDPFTDTLGSLITLAPALAGAGYAENLTAILHANKQDYWIITKMKGNNQIKAWRLSSTGITGPVISTASFSYTGSNRFGQIKVAPHGDRVALVMGSATDGNGSDPTLVIWTFNNSTGVFSNEKIIMTQSGGYFDNLGVDWSITSEIIYVSQFFSSGGLSKLYKIIIWGDCAEVLEITVAATNLGAVQRGPDDEIYIASFGASLLYRIINPNLSDASFSTTTFALLHSCQLGLPVVPSIQDEIKDYRVYSGGVWHSVCDGDTIRFYDGDTASWKDIQAGDRYWNESLQKWETISCIISIPQNFNCYDVIGFFRPEDEGYDPPFNSSFATGMKVSIAAVVGSNVRILSPTYPVANYPVISNVINGAFRDIIIPVAYLGTDSQSKIVAI